jgi:hypothetical protein
MAFEESTKAEKTFASATPKKERSVTAAVICHMATAIASEKCATMTNGRIVYFDVFL